MAIVKFYAHGSECGECIVARQFLTEHKILFEELDIDRSPGALQELVELTGSATHVPVVVIDQEIFLDLNVDNTSRILELTAQ